MDCRAHIFFFKTKNCLHVNDDPFISCNDRIGKMLHTCVTSAYLQWLCHSGEQALAHGPLVDLNLCTNYKSLQQIIPKLPVQ